MNDIANKEDIKIFVDEFYRRARSNELLGKVFNSEVNPDEWPKHLERMYSFWNTVLFGQADYKGNPFSKHSNLQIADPHFEIWIATLSEVIDKYFDGPKADEVKWRAEKMGELFKSKLKAIKEKESNYTIM